MGSLTSIAFTGRIGREDGVATRHQQLALSTGSIASYSNSCSSRARPHAPHAAPPRLLPTHLSRRLRIHYEYTISAESLNASHWAQTKLHLQRPMQTPARCMFAVVRPDHSRPLAANVIMLRFIEEGRLDIAHVLSGHLSLRTVIRAELFPLLR
jgi:hypothetical protein